MNGTCQSEPFQPNLTTTFSVFVRSADLIVSRANYSILSVMNAGPAIRDYSLDLDAYRSALRWLLNSTAAGIPAPSSIAQFFWSAPEQMTNEYWSGSIKQTFQSVLAYPFWFFNENNAGNAYRLNTSTPVDPSGDFYVTASVASPYTKIVVSQPTFIAFIVLQVSAHRKSLPVLGLRFESQAISD